MSKLRKVTVLALVVMALSSCGREKLTPIYQPVTINQLKDDKPISFSYRIDGARIDEYAKGAGKFPIFGKLFQGIAIVLANTTIASGGHELELAETDVDLSSIASVDFEYIRYISLDSLMISIQNAKSSDSLAFISNFEIYMKFNSPVDGLPVNSKGYSKILYFDRTKDVLQCEGYCIKLNIVNVNWKKILKANKLVHIKPKLVINSVPTSTMKLAGSVDFSVKLNVGF